MFCCGLSNAKMLLSIIGNKNIALSPISLIGQVLVITALRKKYINRFVDCAVQVEMKT